MIELGMGQLSWHAEERRTDRYGTVCLWSDASPDKPGIPLPWKPEAAACDGKTGYLVAYVLETRESAHIGDLMRGIYTERPVVDEVVELGPGILFFEEKPPWGVHVGLRPDDGRDTDWLDPHELYRLHQQTVRLYFAAEDDQ